MTPAPHRRGAARALIALLCGLSLLLSGLGHTPAQATTLQQIGPIPLTSITAPGSTTGYGPDGTPRIYWVQSGVPATFNIIDARDGTRLAVLPLPAGTGGSWVLDRQANGDIYIASYGAGHLIKYEWATNSIVDLGQLAPGETFVWAVSHDASTGIVYGSTGQVGGHLVSYDPATGQRRDYGAFTQDPSAPLIGHYVAAAEGRAWIGMGPTPMLFEVDTVTGERRKLAIPDVKPQDNYVGELDVRGDLLFVRMQQSGTLNIYDWRKQRWVGVINNVMGLTMAEQTPTLSDKHSVHFMKPGELWSFNTKTYKSAKVVDIPGFSDVRAFGYLRLGTPDWPGETLIGSTYKGTYFMWNAQTKKLEVKQGDVEGAYASIRSMAEGPDGKVYYSGYLAGGLASYDPATGAKAVVSQTNGQGESITSHLGSVWVGTYPDAGVWRYDPASGEPLTKVAEFKGNGQSRPHAMAGAGAYLAVALVPENGNRGGGLGLVNVATNQTEFHTIVEGHSVVQVAYRDGIIYGSTSIFGGVGAARPPADDNSGYLFAFDVATRTVLWKVKPAAGDGAIGAVFFDKDDNLWTSSPMSIFKVNKTDGTVLATQNYATYPWGTVEYVHGGGVGWFNPYENRIYFNSQARIYGIDPTTLVRASYFNPSAHAFMGNFGYDYVARDLNAWKWNVNDRPSLTLAIEDRSGQPWASATGLAAGEKVELFDQAGASLGVHTAAADGTVAVQLTGSSTTHVQLVRLATRGVVWSK
ncbi:hypothetical protein ACQB6R_04855 [Propionibacteriaceae bacterium G1746]